MTERESRLPRATIIDIAREAGVSISTVSRVLNGNVPVAQETASRVWAAVERLNYTPNAAAKNLASKRANTIGLVLPAISGVFFAPMLRGVESCVTQNGFDLLVYSSIHNEYPEVSHKKPLGEHNCDGLLVFTNSMSHAELAAFRQRGFPLVLLYQRSPEGLGIPSVAFDNRGGTQQLIDHLIEVHNCRRIAFLRGPEENDDALLREEALRAALRRRGLSLLPELVETGDFNPQVAHKATLNLLDRKVRFDALFTGDDEAAGGALLALTERGMRVPTDVRVVGFDDNDMAPLLPVPLTTVHAPIEEAGFEAARQLINLIQTGAAQPETILPTRLVIRRSCGCPIIR